jgi:hypothetical protein
MLGGVPFALPTICPPGSSATTARQDLVCFAQQKAELAGSTSGLCIAHHNCRQFLAVVEVGEGARVGCRLVCYDD